MPRKKPTTKASTKKKPSSKKKVPTKKTPAKKPAKKSKLAQLYPEAAKLNKVVARAVKNFRATETLTVSEWADRKRRLSPETSAEPGLWRTSRTPYLKDPMDCFTDPKVHKIVMVAASQVGKSEFELNAIGYIIDQDPGTILYIHPSLDEAR